MTKALSSIKFLTVLALVLGSFTAVAQEYGVDHSSEAGDLVAHEDADYGIGDPVNTRDELAAFIDHHIKDSHHYILVEKASTGFHLQIPLPIILWDEGLQVFMASKFQPVTDGDHASPIIAENNGNAYQLFHGKIFSLDSASSPITESDIDEHGHVPYSVEGKFDRVLMDFSITKNVLTMIVVALLMLLAFGGLAKQYRKRTIPKGFGRVLEPLVIYVRDEIAVPNIGEKKYRKFMGFLLTVFFFIWISNLMGLTPLGTNLTGSITLTFCLALFTYLITQFSGNKDYWKHIFWMPGVHPIMKIFFIPIELIGTLTKPFALMVRLFANITAGHVVLFTLLGLITVAKTTMDSTGASIGYGAFYFVLAVFITFIELLVAFLQAYIFTLLSALFIGMAVADHDHHHDEEPEPEPADVEDVRERFV